ncbi:hypothetical protein BU17DRAFT_66224 [Hysterangium stoloniferum]|nr:hypothetical protein BU17DRAFT_66224 [Hysterangium stoloniferum]
MKKLLLRPPCNGRQSLCHTAAYCLLRGLVKGMQKCVLFRGRIMPILDENVTDYTIRMNERVKPVQTLPISHSDHMGSLTDVRFLEHTTLIAAQRTRHVPIPVLLLYSWCKHTLATSSELVLCPLARSSSSITRRRNSSAWQGEVKPVNITSGEEQTKTAAPVSLVRGNLLPLRRKKKAPLWFGWRRANDKVGLSSTEWSSESLNAGGTSSRRKWIEWIKKCEGLVKGLK